MLAYLCVINNPGDDLRLQRIINNPPRGIGQKTVDTAQQLAVQTGRSLWEVISHARDYPNLQKAAAKLAVFTGLITNLRQQAGEMSLTEFYDVLCADSGYAIALEAKDTVEDRTRLENVRELQSSIQNYLDNAEEPSLSGFLDEIALYTDLDNHDPNEESVVMMTMHSAKGLEFPVVFVVGAEEGIFPGIRSIGDAEEMEEERRLCYVAMTRAKERLYMVCANQRMLYGRTSSNRPSRFLEEIPEEHVERSGQAPMSGQWRIEESSWRPEREFYDEEESGYSYGEGHRSGGYSYGGSGYPSSGGYSSGGGYQSRRPAYGQSRPGGGSPVSRPARSKQSILKAAAKAAPPLPDFQKGEMVMHKAFGKGMILSLSKMGNDALIEVAFDNVGTKKLMLRSAAQYMEKL